MIDNGIYRYLLSVIISTVDKMTAIGFDSKFHNILFGAEHECPKYGFTAKTKRLVYGCQCDTVDFKTVFIKDPALTLTIRDGLHLMKESLGTYDAHYETPLEYFIKNISGCNRVFRMLEDPVNTELIGEGSTADN
jgi:hypothetical protein